MSFSNENDRVCTLPVRPPKGGSKAIFCFLHKIQFRFPPDAGVPFIYRLDGSLLNIRRLTAETKISHDRVFELQYADDAALPDHSATTLQGSLDVLSSAYSRAGLNVNAKKTEVLSLTTNHDSHAAPVSYTHLTLPTNREV